MPYGHTPPTHDPHPSEETDAAGNKRLVHQFKDSNQVAQIKVKVPKEKDATPVALDWKADFEDAQKPSRRRVINLALRDRNGHAVLSFDPPIEIRVTMTSAEQASASSKLLYYDPTTRRWRDFNASKMGNEFVASISTWYDDPAIGVDP